MFVFRESLKGKACFKPRAGSQQKWCQTLLDDVPKDDDERSKMRKTAKVGTISVVLNQMRSKLISRKI